MASSEQSVRRIRSASFGLRIAQGSWYPLLLIAIGILVASIPGYLASPTLGVLDDFLVLETGSPAYLLARVTMVASFLSAVASISLAVLIFLKKRNERIGLFLSYYLIAHGLLFAGTFELLYPIWEAAPWINSFLLLPLYNGPATVALVALFPDGQFVPSWSRWLVAVAFLAIPGSLISQPDSSLSMIAWDLPASTTMLVGLAIASIVVFGGSIYSQVYRFRYISSNVQKQQTKWVLYGIGLWVLVGIVASIGWNRGLQLPAGTPVPDWLALGSLLWVLSSIILPVALTISITRYHLFDIDLIINQTLVYGALTIGVVLIYILVVSTLGILFQTQFNIIVALMATAVIAVVFQPLREWLQQGVNRLIFGERDDPLQALSHLSDRLEAAMDHESVLPTIVETIARTLRLSYVAIHIINKEKDVPDGNPGQIVGAAHGRFTQETISFPLIVRGKEAGQLVVANRGPGLAFDQEEYRLLKNIAQQAGAAVHSVRLTNDLRKSRQQIVTAREEERRRLRRDLHDGIGPTLAGQMLKLDATLELLRSQPESGQGQSQDEAIQLLTSVKQQTKESIARIRQIVYDLRPPALDDLGLVPAIRTQVAGYQGVEAAPDISLSSNPEKLPQLPAAVEIAIYRIASEALNNIIQHARAEYAHIKLTLSNHPTRQIELEVVDDGQGLPEELIAGVGLTSIRERVEELSGSFKLSSVRPTGTMVQVTIPLISNIDRDGHD